MLFCSAASPKVNLTYEPDSMEKTFSTINSDRPLSGISTDAQHKVFTFSMPTIGLGQLDNSE
jgi:hypothetical protein